MKKGNGKSTRTELLRITPQLAEELLRKNKNNRPLRNNYHERMARDMKANAWKLTGDTIKFDKEGNLIDGQHRLWACLDAEVPFDTFVAYDVEEGSFEVVDSGMKRSPSDAVFLRDKSQQNPGQLTAAANLLWKHTHKYLQKSSPVRPTTKETLKTIDDNPGLKDSMEAGRSVRHIVSPSVATFLHFVFSRVDPMGADRFFEGLATGEGLTTGSAVQSLRDRLIRNKTSLAKLRQRDLLILMIKAWNAFRENRPAPKIPIVRAERGEAERMFPEIR
jgi:hypothetical protein